MYLMSFTTWMIFFTAGTPQSNQCANSLEIVMHICSKLGFLLVTDKIEGPLTLLPFLGFRQDGDAASTIKTLRYQENSCRVAKETDIL